jgi:tRNA uracil 4-sulfurtransferase
MSCNKTPVPITLSGSFPILSLSFNLSYNSILLRYGEVALKSPRKRPFFEKLYISSFHELFEKYSLSAEVKNYGGRFIIHTNDVSSLLFPLSHLPGLQSFSPALRFNFSSQDDLLEKCVPIIKPLVSQKTFAVRVRRDGSHNFSSMELAKNIADNIYENSLGVDLTSPQQSIYLEVRDNEAYLYLETFNGVGGMPAGSSGRALCLFSGGIDSPVSAYQMLKRGCALDYLHIDLGGDESFSSVYSLYAYLAQSFSFNHKPKIFRVPASSLIDFINKNVSPCLRQLAIKIAFYEIAHQFSQEHNYPAVVTGESLAQKSSQTLASLSCIASCSKAFILRPLLSMDKIEITALAQRIGTFSFSSQVKEFCDLSEGNSVTATPQKKDMSRIPNFSEIISSLLENLESYSLKKPFNSSPSHDSLNDFLTPQTLCIDLRLSSLAKTHPLKNTISCYYYTALDTLLNPLSSSQFNNEFSSTLEFSKNHSYLFICEHGVLSKQLAHLCSQKGIKAKGCSVKEYEVHIIT